jgi:2'-hydroxyisoflavone reductase
MDVLVLGGTMFLGRHVVEAARAAGDRVTIFTRGKTNPGAHPDDVERLRGDRDGDLTALEGRRWDAVIDTSGYVPRVVRASAELLRDACDHYTFVSTISVYPEDGMFDADETSRVLELDDPNEERVTGETYGPLKVACERAVQEVYGARASIVRPGLIVGPFDPTERFTYWPRRVAEGGEVLAPADPRRHAQVIDARDLAEWMLRAARAKTSGVFNAVCDPFTLGELLATCETVAGAGARFTWVDDDFLLENDVGPWMELPLWIPDGDMVSPNERVKAAGMTFRPLATVVRDTLEWDRARPPGPRGQAGLAREKEQHVLDLWRKR